MLTPTFDLTHLVVVFVMLIRTVSVALVLLSNHGLTQIPGNVIAEMVCNFIHDYDVQPLSWKRHSSNADDPHPIKKREQMKYDIERVKKCVMNDWLGPIPRCPHKLFNC